MNKKEGELKKIDNEILKLRKEKERKLKIATSLTERNKLIQEIKYLDNSRKSPNALRNFGKTFGKGVGMISRTLWKGITTASRNIETNAPEVREFGKTMTYQPKSSREPPTDLDKMFLPRQPKKTTKKSMSKKTTKKNKSKKRRKKARKMIYNQPKQSANSWELP